MNVASYTANDRYKVKDVCSQISKIKQNIFWLTLQLPLLFTITLSMRRVWLVKSRR